MQSEDLTIHTDGGSRGNPGPAASAFVVEKGGMEIYKGAKYLGIQTNNFAEYTGVLLALNWLKSYQINSSKALVVNFFLDSELVVKQINGLYKVRDAGLKSLFDQVKVHISSLSINVTFRNIPREQNKEADLLVNQELDKTHQDLL